MTSTLPSSSSRYAAPLRVDPRRTWPLSLANLSLHGAALTGAASAALPWPLVLALALLLLASAAATHSATGYYRSLLWRGDGRWELTDRHGAVRGARLLDCSIVTPWLVVLQFRAPPRGQRITILLPAGAADPDDLRRLRVRLRLERDADQAPG